MKNRSAFTLVELVLTIVIITIISSLLWSGISRFYKGIKISSQADLIMAELEWARAYAVAVNDRIDINFEADGYAVVNGQEELTALQLDDRYSFESNSLAFAANGNSAKAGTVWLCYDNKRLLKFVLAPASGLLRWEKL